MGKLNKIKTMLQSMLLEFNNLSTDQGLLQYDGDEIVEGITVWKVDEAGEKTRPEDGTYKTDDGTEYVVADSKVVLVKTVDVKMEEEAPVEPVVTEEQVEQIITEQVPPVEEQEPVTEETEVIVTVEPEQSDEDKKVEDERFNALTDRISALESKIEELTMSFTKFSQEPAQKPVTEEIKSLVQTPTGEKGIDRLRKLMGA